LVAAVAVAAGLQGCTSIDPFGGTAYKTYAASADDVHRAAQSALHHMAIVVDSDQRTATGWSMFAHAADRQINVDVERLTPNTTRLSVVANQQSMLKDKATAAEIVAQTSDAVDARLAARSVRSSRSARQAVAGD
jgi:hypothetical protein